MDHLSLFWAVSAGIGLLLLLILYFKINAFTALVLASILVGALAGMHPGQILVSLQKGMGETLGFVAAVIGLGAMFGGILEGSGGAVALGKYILEKTGERNAPWAMLITGFLLTIPIFFNVAFLILTPMVFAIQKHTKQPLLLYAIPLLTGMIISHGFMLPSAAPLAAAEILKADFGYVIGAALMAGIPAAILAGPVFGRFIAYKIVPAHPVLHAKTEEYTTSPSPKLVIGLICIPIILILFSSIMNSPVTAGWGISGNTRDWVRFAGHPLTSLIVVNLAAWYWLGIKRKFPKSKLAEMTSRSLAPAGVIILVTGAGGMFKQILSETGAGKILAETMLSTGSSLLVCAFLMAASVRFLQGSTTVAIITAAGIIAGVTEGMVLGNWEKALLVTAISAGGILFSHVTDSGFWLIKEYLGLSEKQAFKSWTMMTGIAGFTGFVVALILNVVLC